MSSPDKHGGWIENLRFSVELCRNETNLEEVVARMDTGQIRPSLSAQSLPTQRPRPRVAAVRVVNVIVEGLPVDAYSAARRKFPSCSDSTFTCRGGPIRTGWKNTAAHIVHSSARAISLPMLDMPG